jgi:hypothetical protein
MNNLSFLKWVSFFESTIKIVDFKKILDGFNYLADITEINPAAIIDAELTRDHNPFLYLDSNDTLYWGGNRQYHRNIFASANAVDEAKLRILYYALSTKSFQAPDGAIGRIGYGINSDMLSRGLPEKYLNAFMEKLSIKSLIEAKSVLSETDIIAIYKCPIEIAARSVKKIQEKGEIRDPLKTIVIFDKKAFDFNEFVAHQKDPAAAQPVAAIAQDIKKEPVSFFPKDFKPKTWKDARKWAGLPPTIGDWTNNG